jgi:hypothetical protein
MKPKIFLFTLVSIALWGCSSPKNNSTENNNSDTTVNPILPVVDTVLNTVVSQTITPKMEEIKAILIGDWIEDSTEFKRVYNIPPPPVQNTRVRYQEDGFVYIPGVQLTNIHWDKWEVANDSTLHIIKRDGYGTRLFMIDSISQNYVKYRLLLPPHERKITLRRIK